jgi:hypothetical protein
VANWVTYNLSGGEFINATLPSLQAPQYRFFNGLAESESWFAWSAGGFLGETTGWQFTAPTTLGTYTFVFTEGYGTVTETWTIIVNVDGTSGLLSEGSCCNEDFDIACINQYGGFQNRPFQGVRTFQVRAGTAKEFKQLGSDGSLALKMSEREGVRNAYVVSSGDIGLKGLNSVDQFRQAIQCWRYNSETNLYDIPILIQRESYTKRKSSDHLYEVRFSFVDAEEINVQSQ